MPDNNNNQYERYFQSRVFQIILGAIVFVAMTVSSAYIQKQFGTNSPSAIREKNMRSLVQNVREISRQQERIANRIGTKKSANVADEQHGRLQDRIDDIGRQVERNRKAISRMVYDDRDAVFQFDKDLDSQCLLYAVATEPCRPPKPKHNINQQYAINKRSVEKLERVEITNFGGP